MTLLSILGAAHRFLESEVTINYRRPIRSLQQGGHQQVVPYTFLNDPPSSIFKLISLFSISWEKWMKKN